MNEDMAQRAQADDMAQRIQARIDSAVKLRQETEATLADVEPPGPYEGVLIRDLPAAIRAEAERLGFWRSTHDGEPQAVGVDLDLELRRLAETSPQASAVFGAWNGGRTRVVPLGAGGEPLERPTGDMRQLLDWWSPGGPYASNWPGTPSEPGGLYGLELTGPGRDWYRQATTKVWPGRGERKSAADGAGDYALLDSVPGAPSWDDDDGDYRGKPPEMMATLSARLQMVEHRAVDPRRSTVRTWTGSVGSRSGREALAAARGAPLATVTWLIWQWSAGMDLRLGKLRPGVRAVPALPAEASIVELDGTPFKVAQFPPMTSPVPDFLLAELRKLKR